MQNGPNQGASSQTTNATATAPTTYKVTLIKQLIYQVEVPVLDEYPSAAGAEEAYDDVLGQMHTVKPQTQFSGKVEWTRPTGHTATWEAPVYDPDEPVDDK